MVKIPKIRQTPSKFMAFFRRNQLMLLVTGTFLMVLFLALFAIALSQRGRIAEEQRRDQSQQQIRQIRCILDKTTSPHCDQNSLDIKGLSEDIVFLSDRGIFYDKCMLRLIAEYTRTQRPIRIENVTKCDFVVLDENGNPQKVSNLPEFDPTGNSSRQNTQSSRFKPQGNGATPSPNNNPPPPPEEEPPLLNCTIDILGFHIGCPQ